MLRGFSWIGAARLAAISTVIFMAHAAERAKDHSPAERLLAENRTLVIAHRGYSMLAPENTIPAFDFALAAGADLVELDYYHSKDGVPVVFHDRTLDRTTDADQRWGASKIPVESKTVAELQSLDAGKWLKPYYAGLRIPPLTEALDTIQKKGVTLIERKAGDAPTCVQLLRARNLVNEVVVQAFDWEYLRDFHAQEPRQVLGALGPSSTYNGKRLTEEEKVLSPEWNDIVKETGARLVVWNKNITREAVEDAHKKDLEVWGYTINDEATASKLLDLGIDGIITDNPSIIFKAISMR